MQRRLPIRPGAQPAERNGVREEETWREGRRDLLAEVRYGLDARISANREASAMADDHIDLKAQAANDALQKLVEASVANVLALMDTKFKSADAAATQLGAQLIVSKETAMAAVAAVDKSSAMRHESAAQLVTALETKFMGALAGLQDNIELRARMSAEAIGKAEDANRLRFDSVNEFRQTLTDQATQFVTRPTVDAIASQLTAQMASLETQFRNATDTQRSVQATLAEQVASLTGKVLVGGSAIMVVVLVVQIVLNVLHH